MSNITQIQSFIDRCPQDYPSGIKVSEFTGKLESFFGRRMLQVIGTPVAGAKVSVLDQLEKAHLEGRAVPFFNAIKIVQYVQKQLASKDTSDLEPRLKELVEEDSFQTILTKKNIVWVPDAGEKSLETLIAEAKEGTGPYGLSEELLENVKEIKKIKGHIDLLFPKRGSEVFDALRLDTSKDLHVQFFEQVSPYFQPQASTAIDEIEDIDLSEGLPELEQVGQMVSPSTSSVVCDELDILELDDLPELSLQSMIDTAHASIIQSHGAWVADMAKAMIEQDSKMLQYPSLVEKRMQEKADIIRFALEDFENEYADEVVAFVCKNFQVNPGQDIYQQLCDRADKAIEAHEEKLEYLEELFDENDNFSLPSEAKSYIFYTKTIWPGYEAKGPFSLAEPGTNEGAFLDYDFDITDEVEAKMRDMAEEYAGFANINREIFSIQQQTAASPLIALQAILQLKGKREEQGLSIALSLDDGEKAWAEEFMRFHAVEQ